MHNNDILAALLLNSNESSRIDEFWKRTLDTTCQIETLTEKIFLTFYGENMAKLNVFSEVKREKS